MRCFLGLPFVSVLFLVLSGTSGAVSAQEVVADYSWAREHYAECTDLLLGKHEDLVESPFASSGMVTVRAFADECPERQVSLVAKRDGELEVHVARIKRGAVLEQLLTLHEDKPTRSPADLCRDIPVETEAVDAVQVEKLRRTFEELQERQFSLLPRHLAVIHGIRYSIWISSGQWTAHLAFSDTRGSKARHPLASWAEEILTAAGLSCRPDNAEQAGSS